MDIYTLNVGQGQFVVVTGASEAIIIDTWVPGNTDQDVEIIVRALPKILSAPGNQKNLVGLMVTGFDSDHFSPKGLNIVLGRYLPDWLIYPKYFKDSGQATACFAAIRSQRSRKEVQIVSVRIDNPRAGAQKYETADFRLEVFGPIRRNMETSNNSSLVCKITEKATSASYLVTGDTENDAWEELIQDYRNQLSAHVMAAPHHGSKNGMSETLLNVVRPRLVLASAGVNSQYGHPSQETLDLLKRSHIPIYSTSFGGGQSLQTGMGNTGLGVTVDTYKFSAD